MMRSTVRISKPRWKRWISMSKKMSIMGLLDDTSVVFGWITGECHEFSGFTNVAACFLLD
jgi:hypothetical protein